jgi:hypothetical protein
MQCTWEIASLSLAMVEETVRLCGHTPQLADGSFILIFYDSFLNDNAKWTKALRSQWFFLHTMKKVI